MRGTVIGEPVVTPAQTKELDENWDKTFAKPDRKGGKWVFDEKQQKFVPISEYQPEQRAIDAPIMAGRFYEGVAATDGTDLGSRARHRQYMKDHGLTTIDDYKEAHAKAAEERGRFYREGNATDADKRQRREDVSRTVYELQQKGRGRG